MIQGNLKILCSFNRVLAGIVQPQREQFIFLIQQDIVRKPNTDVDYKLFTPKTTDILEENSIPANEIFRL